MSRCNFGVFLLTDYFNFQNFFNMKQVLKGFLASLLLLVTGIYACQKENSSSILTGSVTKNLLSETSNRGPSVKLKVEGKLKRKIDVRPRDGKVCDCHDCFGICDLKVSVEAGYSPIIIAPDYPVSGQATIYFLEIQPGAESEFGIDENLSVPVPVVGSASGTPLSNLSLNAGIYNYDSTQQTILNTDGTPVTSYGSVVVNITKQG